MWTRTHILSWLREADPARLELLWEQADETRRRCVGQEVHLRGLVEWSNVCARLCAYCGLRADNPAITRYRLSDDEILACARRAVELGFGTLVVQAGEDATLTGPRVAEVVRRIKAETNLAVTLSLGERSRADLAAWRAAGADRYLLRFETSNRELLARIHPPVAGSEWADRFAVLTALRELGYEVGSGVMVGIPGQSYDDLADDIETFERLGLDMIGLGPFLPHPATPLGRGELPALPDGEQVPNTEEMTYKVLALARLARPGANIPATTALATVNPGQGRELGLSRGANVVMPNLTPAPYRAYYEIYLGKACVSETAEHCAGCLAGRIAAIGREVGTGRGDSPSFRGRTAASGSVRREDVP